MPAAAVVARRENYWLLSPSPPRHGCSFLPPRGSLMSVARVARWKPSCLSRSFFHFISILLSTSFPPPASSVPSLPLSLARTSPRSRRQLRWQEARVSGIWMPLKNARECSRGNEKGGKGKEKGGRVSLLLEESRVCKSRFGERISFPSLLPSTGLGYVGTSFDGPCSWERERERRIVVEFDLEAVAVEIEGKGIDGAR